MENKTKVFVIVGLMVLVVVSALLDKEITYKSTKSMTLNNSDIVNEYYWVERIGEGDSSSEVHIWQSLLMYFSEEIGIYEIETSDYSTGITVSQIIEHNYYTGEDTVLREEEINENELERYYSWYQGGIAFDNNTIVYSYVGELGLGQRVIERLDINSKEREIIKTVDNNTYISEYEKLDDDNIVVKYVKKTDITDLERERKYTIEIININTKESKVVYEDVVYFTDTYDVYFAADGNLLTSFCVDNGEIVLLNNYYKNGVLGESEIIIVDTNGNIVNKYLVKVDDSKWKDIMELWVLDDSGLGEALTNVSKVNDYISVKISDSEVTIMYKIIGDELIQIEVPSSFYDEVGVDEISQMKLDKRYSVWFEREVPDSKTEKTQGIIVLDTVTGEFRTIEVNCQEKLSGYSMNEAYIDYDNKMFVRLIRELKDGRDKKEIEVIVDVNGMKF